MNFKLETELSRADILQEIDALKKQLDDLRPLPEDVEGRIMQKLRLDWNYHSNAIEGNKLSYGETVAFLMEGITAKGKPLKDHLDIRGHNEAINFLLSIVKNTRPFSEADIRSLHKMILVEPYDVPAQTADGLPTTKHIALGEYKKLPNHVRTATGETHYYATPGDTPVKMEELIEWYNEISKYKKIHPVVIAALFHHKFVSIHPFDDGNGRLSRILMNLILMQKGYPPVVIKIDDRENYYSLLSRADNNENWPFIEYIAECVFNSLRLYLKGVMGDDIEEDDDIDKEIFLFKREVQSKISSKKEIDPKSIYLLCIEEIMPLIEKIIKKASVLDDLFFSKDNVLQIHYTDFIKDDKKISPIFLTSENLKQSLIFFSNEKYKINRLNLHVQLLKFKQENNTFDVTGTLSVSFDKYEYQITNHNLELNIFTSYNEKLSNEDKKNIISTILKDIKELINNNLDN